ncbi:transmembrane protein, putative [Medicago truncatula]|uniref:Transmembrane protein, putative n=1 Tax=Medicago truncatula TaxID=3880 RepID=A0A072U6X9_MEDTR|nr:transmembrane protein, putative [Medicago truncatula]
MEEENTLEETVYNWDYTSAFAAVLLLLIATAVVRCICCTTDLRFCCCSYSLLQSASSSPSISLQTHCVTVPSKLFSLSVLKVCLFPVTVIVVEFVAGGDETSNITTRCSAYFGNVSFSFTHTKALEPSFSIILSAIFIGELKVDKVKLIEVFGTYQSEFSSVIVVYVQ